MKFVKFIAASLILIIMGCNKENKIVIPYTEYQYNDNGRIITPNNEQLKLIPKDGGEMWNRLVFEKSPYLLQHAANPVDWYPWSDEAFDLAEKINKPIFLSIGYTTCHWCHVMEHESFEDTVVAKLMNDTFVNIKVDREERPDIDNIYMEVTQMINGRGGWPMTVIMTPDQKPFFAGTYFPKNTRYKRMGMMELIPQIKDLWSTKNDSILKSSDKIVNTLERRNSDRSKVQLDYIQVMNSAFEKFEKSFDRINGGFKGSQNKFPKPHDYSFLIRYYNRTKDNKVLDIVNKSLYGMKQGGLYDQIGFGFHRYSTDQKWLVPHFEKMLYDQAMLIHAYLDAYVLTENIYYKETVEEIVEYILRDMTSENGGFYSAEDADSEGEEGTFYIWSNQELKEILTDKEYDFIYDILEFDDKGNCRVEGHYTNIPHFKLTWKEISIKYNLSRDEAKNKYHKIRRKIFDYRENRVHPQKDDKILVDWNGLMISALSRAGGILNNPFYIDAAKNSADFIINNLMNEEGRLLKSYRHGPSNISGMIEDYAFFIWGLIELYQVTFNNTYIDEALILSDYQKEHFWDDKQGGFFFTSDVEKELLIRNKEIYDGAIPSGNSVSAYNYIRLSKILSKPDFEDIAFNIIDNFSSNLKRYSSGYTMLLHTLDFVEGPSYEVIIAGRKEESKEVLSALYNSKQLNKVLIFNHESKKIEKNFLFLEPYISDDSGESLVYVCKNYVCNLPSSNVDEILSFLEK